MKTTIALNLITLYALAGAFAHAQESSGSVLDGKELQYTYSDGGAVVLTFYDEKLKFRWIAGPAEGAAAEDIDYQYRTIGNDIYLVNWHAVEASTFVTLVIDLQQNALFGSALLRYGTEEEMVLFDEAVIERVVL